MNLSIELTAYPLEDEYLPVVEKYIKHLRSYKNIKIEDYHNEQIKLNDNGELE